MDFLKYFIFFLIVFTANCDGNVSIKTTIRSVDVQKTKVWGPGLSPERIVLPVRFFYIHAFDSHANPFNISVSNDFDVQIHGNSYTGKCRVQIEKLNRRDGIYIVRYKIYGTCWNVEIHIQYKEKHVANSPYKISGKVFSDKCRCPQKIEQWIRTMDCEASYEQIDYDLKPFNRVNFTEVLPKILKTFDRPGSISICNYIVKNNEIYRKCYGQHTGFKMFVDKLLNALVRLVEIPDLEFVVNLGDWPLVKKGGISRTSRPLPIFSWCGSDESFDIVMPTYDLMESGLEAMSRVSVDILSVQKSNTVWNEKQPIAFWRGRDARRERLHLIDIARKNPELFNVSLTNFFFFRDEEAKYGPKTSHISFFEFFNFKYQINIDGTVAAYRFPYLLAGNSVVFKQESPFYEHFYKQLSPMYHFIPIKRDLSDLVDKIYWAQNNDKAAYRISQQAQNFVNNNLTADKLLCYYVTLFQKWSERLINPIKIRGDLEKLFIEDDDVCDCTVNAETLRDEL
ncbi:protein O-glucosyltransferase 2-like [Contarinia nasturtii]|uniref:protein O-glucosyltransferase 2-like n=1 Tax=Contarinia nasturtii TaxID=265458 RepID=UPI0012D37C72|nr:protein O-glucosyltransferase 2-like [Contarinia nasturtii]